MARVSKKRKAKKDGKRLRLGKGKAIPSNAVDTSVKARFVSVPTQRIAVERNDDVPTTKRKLTFTDLIAHTKHYSPGVRRDAISGLRELFEFHPKLLPPSLPLLLNTCARVMNDQDAGVRRVLCSFMDWLIPRLPIEMLMPHLSMLFLFITAAETNISPEIAIDALRFLNVLLEHVPRTAINGWVENNTAQVVRVLEGFFGILNTAAKLGRSHDPFSAPSSSSMISSASKLIVLQTLSNFLRRIASTFPDFATETHSSSIAGPPLSIESQDIDSFFGRASEGLSLSSRTYWKADIEFGNAQAPFVGVSNDQPKKPWILRQLSDTVFSGGESDADASGVLDLVFVTNLARALHPTLASTFVECAPTVFCSAASPPEMEVKLLVAFGELIQCLYGAILRRSVAKEAALCHRACEDLMTLLESMFSYFPFRLGGVRDIKGEQAFQSLNFIFCELTSLLVAAGETQTSSYNNKKSRTANRERLSIQIEHVSEYMAQLFNESIERPVPFSTYVALLPTVLSLVYNTGRNQLSDSVLQAAVCHAMRVSPTSSSKEINVIFVSRIILHDTRLQSHRTPQTGNHHLDDTQVGNWINHLLDTLLALQSNHVACAETILHFLLRMFQRNIGSRCPEMITTVRSCLTSYLSLGETVHPYNRSTSSPARRLALDLLGSLPLDELGRSVEDAVKDTEDAAYWAHLQSKVVQVV